MLPPSLHKASERETILPSLSLSLYSKNVSLLCDPEKENGGRSSNSILCRFECFLLSFLVLGTCALFLVSTVVYSGI
jgi:hypothetical protein